MGGRFENGELSISESEKILGDDLELPYFLVGDEIFPLQIWLMRPCSGKALKSFNYHLSRARRIIENTFGILVARWRIVQKSIELQPENVKKLVLAAIALHNYLRQTDNVSYTPSAFIDCKNSHGETIPINYTLTIKK